MAQLAAMVGTFLLAVVNPTSVLAHQGELKAMPGDATMVAESGLTRGGQKLYRAELAGPGDPWQCCFGAERPVRLCGGKSKSAWNTAPGGIGVLARKPMPAQAVDGILPSEPIGVIVGCKLTKGASYRCWA